MSILEKAMKTVTNKFGVTVCYDKDTLSELAKIEKLFLRGVITPNEHEKWQKEKVEKFLFVQETKLRISEIETMWDDNNVTDVTSTSEWYEYENLLGILYQLAH